MLLAQFHHAVAFAPCRLEQVSGADSRINADRHDTQFLIFFLGSVVGGSAMVPNHAQHGLAIGVVARERADLGGDLGRGRVSRRVHQGRQRATVSPPLR